MSETKTKAKLRGPSWDVLHVGVEKLLEQLKDGRRKTFSLSFVVEGYDPYPYLQGLLLDNGDYLFEVVGDFWLEPDLTKTQEAQLSALGWTKPSQTSPNFTKVISGKYQPLASATYLVTSMRVVFKLKRDVWMTLGDSPLDIRVVNQSGFEISGLNTAIFRLPQEGQGAGKQDKK